MAMSMKDREFFDSCDSFKNYASIDEYKADIRRWLTLSDWHYSKEQADKIIDAPERAAWIEQAFDDREHVSSIGADVGYCCG